MKTIKIILAILALWLITIPGLANAVDSNDKLVPCNINGNNSGIPFTQATIDISDEETIGSYAYVYSGVEIGVFKKPADYSPSNPQDADWSLVQPVQRAITDNLKIDVASFGNMSKYDYNQVYTIGYRLLYKPSGLTSNPIVEAEWHRVDNSYFKVIQSLPPAISKFTDRVTAANMWIEKEKAALQTQEERDAYENNIIAKGYNKYMLDSEVVCRFDIDPGNMDVDNYNITLNANTDNDKFGIDYIRIVRTNIGGDVQPNGTIIGGNQQTNDKPGYFFNTNSKTINFDIPNIGTKKISVYAKYRFKKLDKSEHLTQPKFTSTISITATEKVTGAKKTIEEKNIIYIIDTKGIYM